MVLLSFRNCFWCFKRPQKSNYFRRTYLWKRIVQSIIPLKNGGGIRLTISKYYLPSGKSISEVGVLPDIFVEELEIILKLIAKQIIN